MVAGAGAFLTDITKLNFRPARGFARSVTALLMGVLFAVAFADGAFAARRLVGASSNNFPPVNVLDENGRLDGFGWDMANAVIDSVGREVEHIHSSRWTEVLGWLASGKADFIHDTGFTADRTAYLDFSEPILSMQENIFVLKARSDIQLIGSLAGKRVACVNQHITHLYLLKFPRIECHVVATPKQGVEALLAGVVDAFIFPREIALHYIYSMDAEDQVKIVGMPLRTLNWHMVVKKGNAEVLLLLNQGIANVKSGKLYDQIYAKWFGRPLSKRYGRDDILKIIGVAVAIVLVAGCLMLLWLRTLQRVVARRTDELSERERSYRTLFENAASGIGRIRYVGGTAIIANQKFAEIFGYDSPRDCVENFRFGKHYEDLAVRDEILENYEHAPEQMYKAKLRKCDGSLVVVNGHGRLDPSGTYVDLVLHDVTDEHRALEALRETNLRFRQIAENIREVFWMTDPEKNQMIYVSPAYEEIWGRSCESLYREPSTFLDAIHSEDREAVLAALGSQRIGDYDVTYRINRPDGTLRWIRDQAFPVHNEKGKVYRIAGIAEDITDLVHQEEQLRQSQKMELLGQMTGSIAHDFNNLLGVIMGYAEMAGENADDPAIVRRCAETVLQASDSGADLTGRLLAFSRRQTLNNEVTDFGQLISNMIPMLGRVLGETIDIETGLSEDLWHARLDRSQLENALLNLAVNGRDAMPHGGKLKIETANRTILGDDSMPDLPPGEYLSVAVTDSGSGMSKETLSRVFEPFFTTKEVDKGTGLGLAIVYGFVKQSGGDILVESEIDAGTRFELLFPRAEPGALAASEELSSEALGELAGGGRRVLLVEDNRDLKILVTTMLDELGYVTTSVDDANQALVVFSQDPDGVDILLSDVVLPGGLSGPELALKVRALRPDVAVLFMSGYADGVLANMRASLMREEILRKPFNRRRLALAIHDVKPDSNVVQLRA